MDELDLTEFEWNVNIRNCRREDFEAIVAMQLECFPKMQPW
mgnify:CR=1 FL=1